MRFYSTFFQFSLVIIVDSALQLPILTKVKLSQTGGWVKIPHPFIRGLSPQFSNSVPRRKRDLTLKTSQMLTDYFVRSLIPEMVGVQVPSWYCLTNENGSFCHFCELQRSGIVCGWGEAKGTRPRVGHFYDP